MSGQGQGQCQGHDQVVDIGQGQGVGHAFVKGGGGCLHGLGIGQLYCCCSYI